MARRRLATALAVTTVAAITVTAPHAASAASAPITGTVPKDPGNTVIVSPGQGKIAVAGATAKRAALVSPMTAAPTAPTGTGPVRNGTFLSFSLADNITMTANVGSGNLLVQSKDLTLPGINANEQLGEVYNSLLVGSGFGFGTGAYGSVWRSLDGTDVRLFKDDSGSVTYTAPGGVVGVFKPSGSSYTSPGDLKATLSSVAGAAGS